MSLVGAYDDGNIFARLIRGEIPSTKVFEDKRVLAFMDAFPQSPGHCLVVSKLSRARNLLDAEPDVLVELTAAVQRLSRAVEAALKPDGLMVTQFNGEAAGQTVFHLHFHVIPTWTGRDLKRHGGGMVDATELAEQASRIAEKLS